MPRNLTPQSSLENQKREAKRWLKALREDVALSKERLERAFPGAPKIPHLRDIQHALARELGAPGWAALKQMLARQAEPGETHEDRVNHFLEAACPDHHVRGRPDHSRALHTAARLLERYPDIAHDSLTTAVVCGDLAEVER